MQAHTLHLINQLQASPCLAIIDLEATCVEERDPAYPNEIIEIGLVIWNRQTSSFLKKQIYVKPRLSSITPFCTQLTGISDATLSNATPFPQAIQTLNSALSQFPTITHWLSYGAYDKNQFQRQAQRDNTALGNFANIPHVNVKEQAWLALGNNPNRRPPGLSGALSSVGLSFIGSPHSGIDDAYNIARFTKEVLSRLPT